MAEPLPFAVTVDILSDIGMMQADEATSQDQGPFSLLIKRMKGINVNPGGALQIKFQLCPHRPQSLPCDIGVLYHSKEEDVRVVWRYKIDGIAESFLANMSAKLTCKARKTVEEQVLVDVSGKDTEFKLDDYYGENEEFEVEVVLRPEGGPGHDLQVLAHREPSTGVISGRQVRHPSAVLPAEDHVHVGGRRHCQEERGQVEVPSSCWRPPAPRSTARSFWRPTWAMWHRSLVLPPSMRMSLLFCVLLRAAGGL